MRSCSRLTSFSPTVGNRRAATRSDEANRSAPSSHSPLTMKTRSSCTRRQRRRCDHPRRYAAHCDRRDGSIMTDYRKLPLKNRNRGCRRLCEAERRDNVATFRAHQPRLLLQQFDKIGEHAKFTPTFNLMAGLFGPIWFGARGLWNWALPF